MGSFGQYFRRKTAKVPVIKHVIDLQQDVAELKRTVRGTLIDDHLARHLHGNEKYADPKRLNRYEFQVFSQNGEDGVLAEIFRRIGTKGRYFVEFGVGNGTENNSVRLLLEGWKGLWIECSAKSLRAIRHAQAKFLREGSLTLRESMINAENVEGIFAEAGVPAEPDLLSIDIDGNDYWVWKAIQKFSPRVVMMEYNALFRPPIRWVRAYDPAASWKHDTYYGASLASLAALAEEKGYALVGCGYVGVNAFFVRKDLLQEKFAAPFTAEHHYEPLRLHLIRDASPYPVELGEFEAI
jgi:hypothetical protein